MIFSWILWQCDSDEDEALRQFLKLIAPVKLEVPSIDINRVCDVKALGCFMRPDPCKAIQVPSVCKEWDRAEKYIMSSSTTQVLCIRCPEGCLDGITDSEAIHERCGL